MSAPDNLFEESLRPKLERLLAKGWKTVDAFGRTYYERPFDHAWLSPEDAAAQPEAQEDAKP